MTTPVFASFQAIDLEAIASAEGRVAVITGEEGKLDPGARRVNRLTKGALGRLVASDRFSKMKAGDMATLAFPVGMAAEAVDVVKLEKRVDPDVARKAGAKLAQAKGKAALMLLAGNHPRAAELVQGTVLRAYAFTDHKSKKDDETPGAITACVAKPEELQAAAAPLLAVAEGVFFTRDLVSEPANVLTTEEFATRLLALDDLGLKVSVLDEPELEKQGMGALLAVGRASHTPSKVVVMEWQGGAPDAAPLALVGKGVVFDTGGISLKPPAGMEEMTMDMGGAGTVAGVMRTLALRKAKANVVGLVGLVENMPAGNAMRPGDIVTSMKGDTIEVNNTDAEGRLVLCDVMWYAQETFKPCGMIDLATLTGAAIVALGHDNAATYSTDDALCKDFLKAAEAEGEGAWRMPLGAGYAKIMESRLADVKNSGGRAAGSITAAEFLKRFVQDDVPWIHLDIAGVAFTSAPTPLAPKGPTGWGVRALDRLIADNYEAKD